MKLVKMILAAGALLTVLGSAALAQQAGSATGLITKIDRTTGVIAIKRVQEGTVGANTEGAEDFKLQGGSLEQWHVGDRVSFTANDARTITKIELQSSAAR